VAAFTKLGHLSLSGSRVSDAGMAHVASLTSLRSLDLSSTEVGDAGLARLCDLKWLQEINLFNTHVTDTGLADLCGKLAKTSCRFIVVSGPNVTASGVEVMRSKLPRIRINWPDLQATNFPSSALK
jgi:hypothetical protein